VTCRSCAEREKLRVSARLTKSSSHLVSTRVSVATRVEWEPRRDYYCDTLLTTVPRKCRAR
jgi:hypothetical protein